MILGREILGREILGRAILEEDFREVGTGHVPQNALRERQGLAENPRELPVAACRRIREPRSDGASALGRRLRSAPGRAGPRENWR